MLKEQITLDNLRAKITFRREGDDDRPFSGLFCKKLIKGLIGDSTTSITLAMSEEANLIMLVKDIENEFYIVTQSHTRTVLHLVPENKLPYGTWKVSVNFRTPAPSGVMV